MSIFSFYGRARRTTYGLFVFATLVAFFAFSMGFFVWMIKTDQNQIVEKMRQSDPNSGVMLNALASIPMSVVHVGAIVCAVLLLALYIAWVATCVRRLHDMNATGWLVLIFIIVALIPYLGYILVSILLGFWPGTKGRNKYGPDPRLPLEISNIFESAPGGPQMLAPRR